MPSREGLVAALVFVIALLPNVCFGGGILHVFPPKLEDKTFAVARPTMLVSRTSVTVSENDTRVKIDQTFLNDNEFPLEGLFVLPLKETVRPVKLEVRVDGAHCPFRIISADEFFPTLKDLTLTTTDPSLLGLAGKDVLLIRPIGIAAGGQKSFCIQYELPLRIQDERMDLTLSLAGERYSLGPVGEFEIRVRFTMSRTIRTVFSPTHHLTVFREAPHRCLVTTRTRDAKIGHDLRLLTTFSGRDLNLRIFVHASQGMPGAFMAFIEPPYARSTEKDTYQDIVIMLDASGSMTRAGFERAKAVAVAGLERMRAGDKFNVMTVSTQPARFADRFVAASRENVLDAIRFVNSQSCEGGSDLYNSLIDALEVFESRNRSNVVLLISDGRATVGITEEDTIVEHIRKSNHAKARIFVTAIGNDADMTLLDRLATSTKGGSVHLFTTDDFDSTMKPFFSRISHPKVSDLSLEFQGASIEDVMPSPIPDLFGTESVIVFGRILGDVDKEFRATLRGKVNERVFAVSKTRSVPHAASEYPYIPEIWAMRQMALLMGKRRLKGPLPEVANKAANLANEFGFINPVPPGSDDNAGNMGPLMSDLARLLWRFKTSHVPADVASPAFRRISGKVFRRDGSGWVDTAYRPDLPTTEVRFLSDMHFSQLQTSPEIGEYLALGPKVTVVLGGRAIRVEP